MTTTIDRTRVCPLCGGDVTDFDRGDEHAPVIVHEWRDPKGVRCIMFQVVCSYACDGAGDRTIYDRHLVGRTA